MAVLKMLVSFSSMLEQTVQCRLGGTTDSIQKVSSKDLSAKSDIQVATWIVKASLNILKEETEIWNLEEQRYNVTNRFIFLFMYGNK